MAGCNKQLHDQKIIWCEKLNDFYVTGKSILGRSVLHICGSFYKKDNYVSNNPLNLFFVMPDGQGLRLSCSPDGESINFDSEPISSFSMGGDGEVIVWRVSGLGCLGGRIKSIRFAVLNIEDKCIGVKFVFEDEMSVAVINQGDELVVGESFPDFLYDEDIHEICVGN